MTIAVVGVLVGTSYLVGKTAIGDIFTIVVAVTALAAALFVKKIPDSAFIPFGAALGLVAYPLLQPSWMLR